MNALVWNARGLGNNRAFHELRRVITDVSPNIVFISETKMHQSRCVTWRVRLGYDGIFFVDAEGKSGGLVLLWRTPFKVTIRSYSKGHIDCMVERDKTKWRFTGFYGNPVTYEKVFVGFIEETV